MNNEDLYHGITEIRDDQILEAEQPAVRARRSRRAVWLGAAAAAIVLIIVFGVWILPALRAGKEPEPSGPNIQIMSGPDQTDAQSSPDSDPDKSETPTFPDQDSSAEPYLPGTDESESDPGREPAGSPGPDAAVRVRHGPRHVGAPSIRERAELGSRDRGPVPHAPGANARSASRNGASRVPLRDTLQSELSDHGPVPEG